MQQFMTKEELAALEKKGGSADDHDSATSEEHALEEARSGSRRRGIVTTEQEAVPGILSQQPAVVKSEAPENVLDQVTELVVQQPSVKVEVMPSAREDIESSTQGPASDQAASSPPDVARVGLPNPPEFKDTTSLLVRFVAALDPETRWPCPHCDRRGPEKPVRQIKYRTEDGRSYYEPCWFCATVERFVEGAKALIA